MDDKKAKFVNYFNVHIKILHASRMAIGSFLRTGQTAKNLTFFKFVLCIRVAWEQQALRDFRSPGYRHGFGPVAALAWLFTRRRAASARARFCRWICKPLESFRVYRSARPLRNTRAGKALMSEADDKQTARRPEKASEQVRLAEALRDNLRRRKAQTRARTAAAEVEVKSQSKPPAET